MADSALYLGGSGGVVWCVDIVVFGVVLVVELKHLSAKR